MLEKRKATRQLKQKIQFEEINKKVVAKEGRLKRYWDRIKQYRQYRTFQSNEKILWDINGSPNLGQTTRSRDSQQKKKKWTCRIGDFAVSAYHKVKFKKKTQKRDEY